YWYPPTVGYAPSSLAAATTPEALGYEVRRERHIPDNTVALKVGASVAARDGHTVGKLEEIIMAPASKQATHIVISEGVLNKTHRVIPLGWVDTISEKTVSLVVSSELIEHLPLYQPAS